MATMSGNAVRPQNVLVEEKTAPPADEHLLEHTWTLYFRPPADNHSAMPKAEAWEGSQREMFQVNTVEGFWRSYNSKVPRICHSHPVNCDYSLFRSGIKPMWEDPTNKNGGRWNVTLERRTRPQQQLQGSFSLIIENAWMEVMLSLIGEQFEPDGDKICGGVVGLRLLKNLKPTEMFAKVSIWTKDANDDEANLRIGQKLKEVLKCASGALTYQAHEVSGARKNAHKLSL